MLVPDNLDLYESHERKQTQELNRLPVCSICEEPIQDETAYYIDGEFICHSCMELNYEVQVEDYVE